MLGVLNDWLLELGMAEDQARLWTMAGEVVVVIAMAFAANLVAKRVVVRTLARWTARTATRWDDLLMKRRALHRISHLAPALVLYHFGPGVLAGYPGAVAAVQAGCLIYMLMAGAWAVSGLLDGAQDIVAETSVGRDLPVKSFVQVLKILLFGVMSITVLSLVIGKSPVLLFSGLGAMTAVLMLVFKDPILGFVAGIQLSANRMVSRGDWIEMPKYGADGDVIDVALTTVKVQNWDKTITTIPTQALINESFKNWRGMSESGGRRIKRAIHVDMTSIRFCDDATLKRYGRIQHVSDYIARKREEIAAWNRERGVDPSSPANGRRLTNVGTFRAYIVAYLRHHPLVHRDMTFLVRQLAPTAHGLPIEIYVFSRDQRWARYEDLQSDIFDHILAVAPEFDIRLYQSPSGHDLRELRLALAGE